MCFFKKWRLARLNKKIFVLYKQRQENNNVSTVEINKEIDYHKQLIIFYKKNRCKKTFPHADLYVQESLRVIALLNDKEAQYQLAKTFFDWAKFWENMKNSFYNAKIYDHYIENAYNEAYAFLKEAEEQGYPLATRLHGLALIHGWGKGKDQELGFKFIVDSIEQEKAWDRATKIFEELELNKPEFFGSLMAVKNKKS